MNNGGDKAIKVFKRWGTDVEVVTGKLLKDLGEQQVIVFSKLIKAAGFHAEAVFGIYRKLPTGYVDNILRRFSETERNFLERGWYRYANQDRVYKGIYLDPEDYGEKELRTFAENIFRNGFAPKGNNKELLAHILDESNADTAFVSTSKLRSIATEEYAKNSGLVFEIDPRALNGINAQSSILPNLDSMRIPQETKDRARNYLTHEQEISFIGGIDSRDIKGAWQIERNGQSKYIPNEHYLQVQQD